MLWFCLYLAMRFAVDVACPWDIQGWSYSSYVAALAHQLAVLPLLWYCGAVTECLHATIAYFATDVVHNRRSFDIPHVVHHAVSVVLLLLSTYALSPLAQTVSTEWLVILELGSSGVSLSPLVGGARRFRALLYGFTRCLTVYKMARALYTVEDSALYGCYVASIPLLAHNACVFRRMLQRIQR